MSPPGPAQDVVVERNLLIPLPDGVHLAADLYRPETSMPRPRSETTLGGKPVRTRTWSRGLADRAQSGGTS